MRWAQACTAALGKLPAAARQSADAAAKSAAWKVAVAAHLKATTDVSNGWLAERLEMGSGVYVSKHVGLLRRGTGRGGEWLAKLTEGKG